MNQQKGNIYEAKLKKNRYLYILVGLGFVLSIVIQWYAAALITLIWMTYEMREKWRISQIEELCMEIKGYPWYAIHELLKDSLEILKCRRMIERGYDSRANTNIILQEEKQQLIPFKPSPSESAIIHSIITISHKLYQLRLIKIQVFCQQSTSEIAKLPSQIGSFRELFNFNREIDKLIEELSTLNDLLKSRIRQPLLDPSPRYHLMKEGRSRILPLLLQIQQEYICLKQMVDKQMEGTRLSPQFQSYLNTITKESPSEAELQALMAKIKQIQDQNHVPDQPQCNQANSFQENHEQSSSISKQTQKKAQIEQPSPNQRREFMKKLDKLLLVGLAKRRQEEFQRKMQLMEQEQASL